VTLANQFIADEATCIADVICEAPRSDFLIIRTHEGDMATIYIGIATLAQGKSAYWWWNFNGAARTPFFATAVPSNTFANNADLRTHDIGIESSFGPPGTQGIIFYTHHAVVTSWSGSAVYSLMQGDLF
jgi:hypothetical protein